MDAGALTATITAKLIDSAKSAALGTGDITRTALQTLERFDSAAAVQYAAYHKN
jgi:transcriptional regulator NrdR family protein